MKKNLLLAAAMLLCVSGLRAAGITLYGATTGIDELTEKYRTNVGGIVKFGAEAPLTQTPVFDDVNTGHLSGINSNTVANFGNNKIYVYRWVDAQGSLASVKYYVYSLDDDGNWTHDCNKDLTLNTSYDAFPNAMTYNPQSNIMYGFRNGMDPGGSTIYTIDPETGRMSKKTVAQTYLSSLTTTPLGLTYATDYEGNFYSVDMESGMLDYKGATGVPCDNIMQGWYDAATQTFFLYAAQTNSSQTLYTVNLETGAATKVGDFDGSCAFMKCIFSLSELENQDFPDICSELTVTPTQNGSLSTTLSARAPKYTYDKTTELRGNVTLKFFVDNDNLPVETFKDVSPSETVSTPYTFTSVGTHRISVVAENEKGEGAMLSTTRWIGFDTPCAPSDLLLDIDKNGNWTASWQAPTTGINGGDIDSANLKYEFCINPDGTKQTLSNTTVSGTFEAPQYTGYWFEVKADAGGLTSESILSKQAGFGKPFDAPIYMDFATQAKWALHSPEVMSGSGEWINLKIFEDQEAWAICDNRYADRNDKDLPPATENADAWLLTPPINMHAGVKYTITAIATSLTETGGNISFYEGEDGAQLNNYKHIYTDKDIVFVLDGLMQLDYEYTATTEHVGRFAFRCNSIPGNMTCIINYQIEATESANAPAAVENLKVTAGEKGALNTTISFDVPSKTIGGNTLSNVENVKIFRDKTELVASLYDIVPGQKDVNIIDNNPKQGEHTYTIQVFNEFAGGLRSEATLWVGEDTPVAPQNFNVEENDTEYILTWDTPDAGMHNAYIDFDKITYTVSFEYDPMENSAVYQSGIKENTISIPKEFFEEQLSDRQTLLTFYVSGQTSAGAGKATWYDYLYGKAYDASVQRIMSRQLFANRTVDN